MQGSSLCFASRLGDSGDVLTRSDGSNVDQKPGGEGEGGSVLRRGVS